VADGGGRRDIVTYGVRLHERGFVAATDGNLSARLGDKGFLATPTGLPKEELREEVVAVLDGEGRPLSGKPSSEWPMHYAIYRLRPDVGAVVHAHPPFATALACSGHAIDRPFLSEAVISLGTVPLVPFELPSTGELAERVARTLSGHDAVLMANHGAVTVGPDVRTAYYRMETLEQTARIFLYAELLGGGRPLPQDTVEHLKGLGAGYRMAELPAPVCEHCPVAAGEDGLYLRREELVKLLAEFGSLYPGMGIK
jgi:L-fuculose-phosphate aldolase